MSTKLSADAKYRLFLAVMSGIGIVLGLIATSRFGAGVSSDAARNLATAESLVEGRGFVDMVNAPLVLWPPLYPLLLAGLSILVGASPFVLGWYLNVLLLGLNVWLGGTLLYQVFRHRPWLAMLGVAMLVFSRSSLRIHANIASEPLFESLLLIFLLAAGAYNLSGSSRSLWTMCAAAGLGALQRYLGVAMIGAAAVVLIRRNETRSLRRVAVPWILTSAPIAAWSLLHNLPVSGSLFGPRDFSAMLPLKNIELSLTKILWWFAPRWGFLDWLILRPWIPILALALVLVMVNSRQDWLSWLRDLSGPYVWPAMVFSVVYFVLLAFTVVTADHLDLTSDRYYVVLLPSVIVLLLVTADRLILGRDEVRRRRLPVIVSFLALWALYPVYTVGSYLQEAVIRGEPTNYNIANSAAFREMSVVKAAEEIVRQEPDAVVYSNYVNIVWFILGHPVETLPFQDETLSRAQRLEALHRNYAGWPQEPGYIVWFTPNQYHHIVPPDELGTVADLTLLFGDETGQVFWVEPVTQ